MGLDNFKVSCNDCDGNHIMVEVINRLGLSHTLMIICQDCSNKEIVESMKR